MFSVLYGRDGLFPREGAAPCGARLRCGVLSVGLRLLLAGAVHVPWTTHTGLTLHQFASDKSTVTAEVARTVEARMRSLVEADIRFHEEKVTPAAHGV